MNKRVGLWPLCLPEIHSFLQCDDSIGRYFFKEFRGSILRRILSCAEIDDMISLLYIKFDYTITNQQ